jgi:hypothetical protein
LYFPISRLNAPESDRFVGFRLIIRPDMDTVEEFLVPGGAYLDYYNDGMRRLVASAQAAPPAAKAGSATSGTVIAMNNGRGQQYIDVIPKGGGAPKLLLIPPNLLRGVKVGDAVTVTWTTLPDGSLSVTQVQVVSPAPSAPVQQPPAKPPSVPTPGKK